MNENIAFSPIEAEKLNKKVRDTLAEHLFVLCNYNPDSIMVFSEDARFMQASLNMYKFLVDAGICNNLRSIGKKYSINYDYVRLENIVKNINSIRSTLGHNLDERNGTEEDKEAVEQWFLKVVGKKQLTNAEEYKKVVEEIEKYGEVFLVMCNQMRNRNYNDGAVLHWKNDKEIFWKKMENGIGNHIYDYMKLEFMLIPNKFV